MASTGSPEKKRPPPIQIPPPRIQPKLPGPNAFAKQAEASLAAAPVHLALPAATSQAGKSEPERLSRSTTFTSLIERARSKSPRKSDVSSSTTSRHASSTRSRYSNRSKNKRTGSSAMDGDEKTSRGHIESRSENKLFQLVGQPLPTPAVAGTGAENGGVTISRFDFTQACRAETSEKTADELQALQKSPKKKIFGVTIPTMPSFSRTATATSITPAIPAMPSKAAQVLGTAPPATASPAGRGKSTERRSQSSNRRNQHRNHHSATPSQEHKSPEKIVQWKDLTQADVARDAMVPRHLRDHDCPPTPPEKDTPPDSRIRQSGEAVVVPVFGRPTDPIPPQRGISPSKWRPYGAEDYAQLIAGKRIPSACAEIEDSHDDEGGGNLSAPLEGTQQQVKVQPKHWSDETHKRYPVEHCFLPPRFYSPSNLSIEFGTENGRPSHNTDSTRYLFAFAPKYPSTSTSSGDTRGTIDMVFQGTENEINVTSGAGKPSNPATDKGGSTAHKANEPSLGQLVMKEVRELRDGEAHESPSRSNGHGGGVSPSKAGYTNDFVANCPSALPSPLYGNPHQGMPPPMMGPFSISPASQAGTLSDGSNILTHFWATHEHIDVLGRTVYDMIEHAKGENIEHVNNKHNDLIAILQEQVNEIKSGLGTVSRKVEHASEHNQALNAKLDNLVDFIKKDFAEPLAMLNRKTTEMESNIKATQKVVQDLSKLVETAMSPNLAQSQASHAAPANFQLPTLRSQPSLASYYDSASDSGRDGSARIPPMPDMRNGYRYGNNHGPNQAHHGQNWSRPNGYNYGGYPAYYPNGDHQYGYGQNGSK